ncbi:unnamed protein product [Auanema sp. JU1783]|nr:unnamed protein product [Auanema sp. JU1783]
MAADSAPSNTADQVLQFLQETSKRSEIEDFASLEFAQYLTETDPLKHLREQFHYPKCKTLPDSNPDFCDLESESVYLCGHSLGLLPKPTERIMQEQLKKWSELGVVGHTTGDLPWAHCDEKGVPGVAQLVGAKEEEVAICNGLTVNIHVLLSAFYRPTDTRHKILIESKAFPSDHYAVESQIRLKGRTVEESLVCLSPREGEDILRDEDIIDYIEKHGDEIAVIWFAGVQYYTGQLFDMKSITEAGHRKGCLVGFDLAHAFINVPLQLHYWDVDFAAWCSYKYGCTGAGGIAGLFVHERFKNDKRDRMLGWWSHKMSSRFIMDNVLDLDEGAAGYRISNPPILLVVPIMGILEVLSTVKLEDLRSRSCYLTGYLEYLINHHFAPDSPHRVGNISCEIITPSNFHQRGCQLSLKFNIPIDAIYSELVKRGCAIDKRYPFVIRISPVHLYNNYVDCHRFVSALLESAAAVQAQAQ